MNPALPCGAWAVILVMLLAIRSANAQTEPAGPGVSAAGEIGTAPAQGATEPATATRWWSPESLGLGVKSWSEVARLGTWGGSLDSDAYGTRQQTRQTGNPDFTNSARLTSEGITIRNQGLALIDPRLSTGSAMVRFALQQSYQSGGGVATSQNGTLTSYAFENTLLPEKPYNASIFANRSQTITSQISGTNTQSEYQSEALVFRLREDNILREKGILPYFSATVTARQEQMQQESRLAGQVFKQGEQRTIVGLTAHNGFETGDLNFRYEKNNVDNLLYPAGSYGSQVGSLSYSGDFGRNRNRHWDSTVDYGSRSGSSPITNLNVNQRLTIDHYTNLSSAYNYGYLQQEAVSGTSTVQIAGAQVQHRLYNNLSSSLGVNATQQVIPNGTIDSRGAQAAFSYNHGIAWGGQLYAGLGSSLQITDNQLQSAQIAVPSSSYLVPAPFGVQILLKNTNIVTSSIVVKNVTTGNNTLSSTTDYQVVVTGNQTSIMPINVVTMRVGDQLDVSYYYNVDQNIKFRTTSNSLSLGADWSWIAFSANHEETIQTQLSGGDNGQYLSNRRSDGARVELRGNWPTFQARADAAAARYNYTTIIYDELRLSQRFTYSPSDNLLLSVTASQVRADYSLPQRHSDGTAARLDVDWVVGGGWFTNTFVAHRVNRDTQLPMDTVTEASFRVRRRWSKLNITGTLGLADRTRGGVQTTSANAHISLIRDF